MPVDLMRLILDWTISSGILKLWLSGDSRIRLLIGPYGCVTTMKLVDHAPMSESKWPMMLSQLAGLKSLSLSRGIFSIPNPLIAHQELLKLKGLQLLHLNCCNSPQIIFGRAKFSADGEILDLANYFPVLQSLALNRLPYQHLLNRAPDTLQHLRLDQTGTALTELLDLPPSLTSLGMEKAVIRTPTQAIRDLLSGSFVTLKLVKLSIVLENSSQIVYFPKTLAHLILVVKYTRYSAEDKDEEKLPTTLETLDVTPAISGSVAPQYRYLYNLKELIIRRPIHKANWPSWKATKPMFPISLTKLSLAWLHTPACPIILPPRLTFLHLDLPALPNLPIWTEMEDSNFNEISTIFLQRNRNSLPGEARENPIIGTANHMLHPSKFATQGLPPGLIHFGTNLGNFSENPVFALPRPIPWIISDLVSLDVLQMQVPSDFIQTLLAATRLQSLKIGNVLENFPAGFCPNLAHLTLHSTVSNTALLYSIPKKLSSLHISVSNMNWAVFYPNIPSPPISTISTASMPSPSLESKSSSISYESDSLDLEMLSPFFWLPCSNLKHLKWEIRDKPRIPILGEMEWAGLKRFEVLETLEIDFGFNPSLRASLMKKEVLNPRSTNDDSRTFNPYAILPRSLERLSINGKMELLSTNFAYFGKLPRGLVHLRLVVEQIPNIEVECVMMPRNVRSLFFPKTLNFTLQALHNLPCSLETLVVFYQTRLKSVYEVQKLTRPHQLKKPEYPSIAATPTSKPKSSWQSIYNSITSFFSSTETL